MKPIKGNPLTFEISKGEKERIEIIRKNLLRELSAYAEVEREWLIDEVERFLMPQIIAEHLERVKLDVFNNLAFNSFYYSEKCFYIDANGDPAITQDINLFYSFVYAYSMLGKEDKGIWTARNIIKVCIIDRMVKMTLQEMNFKKDWATSTKNNLYPFVNVESKNFFAHCVKYWLNERKQPKTYISYLFRKMWVNEKETDNFKYKITNITIREFAEYWNNHIKHKHNYKIKFDGKTAKIKTLSEMPSSKLEQRFINLVNDFES